MWRLRRNPTSVLFVLTRVCPGLKKQKRRPPGRTSFHSCNQRRTFGERKLPHIQSLICVTRAQLLRAKSQVRFHGSQNHERRSRMGGWKVGLSFPTVRTSAGFNPVHNTSCSSAGGSPISRAQSAPRPLPVGNGLDAASLVHMLHTTRFRSSNKICVHFNQQHGGRAISFSFKVSANASVLSFQSRSYR